MISRVSSLALLLSFACGSVSAQGTNPLLLPSVAKNLRHIDQCLQSGNLDEARAYVSMTLFERSVRYSLVEDEDGVGNEAVKRWESILGGTVVFEETPRNCADLVMRFEPAVDAIGHDVFGMAHCRRQVTRWSSGTYTYSQTGFLEVATHAPNGTLLNRETKLQAAMHELGHYLGLDDTPVVGELMGPVDMERPVVWPSWNELSALSDLRAQASLMASQARL